MNFEAKVEEGCYHPEQYANNVCFRYLDVEGSVWMPPLHVAQSGKCNGCWEFKQSLEILYFGFSCMNKHVQPSPDYFVGVMLCESCKQKWIDQDLERVAGKDWWDAVDWF